jgi:glycosyltransferase involved in cell wall biosynthesis
MKISILIPTFNSAATIAPTRESIQNQLSIQSKISAVYLADDCSKDETIAIAQTTWRSQVPLLVIPRDSNLGQWPNVNTAIDLLATTSDWILI